MNFDTLNKPCRIACISLDPDFPRVGGRIPRAEFHGDDGTLLPAEGGEVTFANFHSPLQSPAPPPTVFQKAPNIQKGGHWACRERG